MPRVTVIMPCHNGARFVGRAIRSVLDQSYTEIELLVVDNNSTDDSVQRIGELAAADPRAIPLHCSTPGAAHARNFGIERASGRYIAFLDCDDWWQPYKLERQIAAMEQHGAAMCWSSYHVVDSDEHLLRTQMATSSIDYESHMTKRSVIGCLTVIYDTHLLGKMYMPFIKMRQDYALWAAIIRKSAEQNLPLVGLLEPLASYRIHDSAMTRNKLRAARYQWTVYREVERHSLWRSVRYFLKYVRNAMADRR